MSEPSTYQRSFRFGPIERRGIAGGLRPGQVAMIGAAALLAVAIFRRSPSAAGLFLCPPRAWCRVRGLVDRRRRPPARRVGARRDELALASRARGARPPVTAPRAGKAHRSRDGTPRAGVCSTADPRRHGAREHPARRRPGARRLPRPARRHLHGGPLASRCAPSACSPWRSRSAGSSGGDECSRRSRATAAPSGASRSSSARCRTTATSSDSGSTSNASRVGHRDAPLLRGLDPRGERRHPGPRGAPGAADRSAPRSRRAPPGRDRRRSRARTRHPRDPVPGRAARQQRRRRRRRMRSRRVRADRRPGARSLQRVATRRNARRAALPRRSPGTATGPTARCTGRTGWPNGHDWASDPRSSRRCCSTQSAVRSFSVVIEPVPPSRSRAAVEAAITSDEADEELRRERGFRTTARRRSQQAATAAPGGRARRGPRGAALRRLPHRLRT